MAAPQEAFLSHSHQDREAAEELVGTLARHGIPVWYSPTAVVGAQQWHDEIGRALRRCDWFLLLLTPRAVASTWVKRELLYALRTEGYFERITPLLLEACDAEELSWTLPDLQTIDLSESCEDGYRQVLRAWGIGYRPPDPEPGPPTA